MRADVSIHDCIEMMKNQNVGAILVISDDETQKLIGIFTERDLVRTIKLVDEGKHLTKPIRTVMTKNVKTIDISDMHSAIEIMIKNGFRHLPVLAKDKNGVTRIMGVVSMRDLMRKINITSK